MTVVLLAVLLVSLALAVVFHIKLKQNVGVALARRAQLERRPEGSDNALPSLSVLIVCRNAERQISRCLKNLIKCVASESGILEIVLVDDGSDDRTFDIMRGLKANLADPRIKIIQNKAPPGGRTWTGKGDSTVRGIDLATGDHLLFVSPSAALSPQGVEKIRSLFSNSEADFLTFIPSLLPNSFFQLTLFQSALRGIYFLTDFSQRYFKPPSDISHFCGVSIFTRSGYEKNSSAQGLFLPGEDLIEIEALPKSSRAVRVILENVLPAEFRSGRRALLWAVMLMAASIPWLGFGVGLYQLNQSVSNQLYDAEFFLALNVTLISVVVLVAFRMLFQHMKVLPKPHNKRTVHRVYGLSFVGELFLAGQLLRFAFRKRIRQRAQSVALKKA